MIQWETRIILFFLLFYLIIGGFFYVSSGKVASNQDFDFHFKRINGVSDDREYSPLYHILFFPFGFNVFVLYAVNVVFVCLFIPFLILKIGKSGWGVIAYFCGTSLPHAWLYGSTFPHMLTFFWLLCYFALRKKEYKFNALLFFWVLASFTHSKGFLLFGLVFGLEILELFWGVYKNRVLGVGFLMYSGMKTLADVVMVFLVYITAPVVVYGLKGISLFYGLLIPASFYMAYIDMRGISLAQIVLVLSCGKNIEKVDVKTKNMIILFFVFMVGYYILDYVMGSWKMIIFN